MKTSNDRFGFTLMEIMVVLIIVGILAAIALPNFFKNVNKSKTEEAFAQFEQYKTAMELCLNMNIGAEANCANGVARSSVSVPSSTANMSYMANPAPSSKSANNTGVSQTTLGLQAYLTSQGSAAGYVMLTRNSNGTWAESCSGIFLGVCTA